MTPRILTVIIVCLGLIAEAYIISLMKSVMRIYFHSLLGNKPLPELTNWVMTGFPWEWIIVGIFLISGVFLIRPHKDVDRYVLVYAAAGIVTGQFIILLFALSAIIPGINVGQHGMSID